MYYILYCLSKIEEYKPTKGKNSPDPAVKAFRGIVLFYIAASRDFHFKQIFFLFEVKRDNVE